MSWFKDTVEDWDMVGKALRRSLDREPVQITDTKADDEDEELAEVDLTALRMKEMREQQKNKQQAEQAKKILSGE